MSSKPSTPILQRRYADSEFSRIPVISRSPIPFHRTNSMRTRPNCLLNQLNESTLKQHNKNFSKVDEREKLKLNLQRIRRGSFSMDTKSDANNIDAGGTDEVDKSAVSTKQINGDLRRNSYANKNDRGLMVSCCGW